IFSYATDIGAPSPAGYSTYNRFYDAYTVNGGGAGLAPYSGNYYDQFQFLNTYVGSGLSERNVRINDSNFTMTARITGVQGGYSSQTGIMVRSSDYQTDNFAFVGLVGNYIVFMNRGATNVNIPPIITLSLPPITTVSLGSTYAPPPV